MNLAEHQSYRSGDGIFVVVAAQQLDVTAVEAIERVLGDALHDGACVAAVIDLSGVGDVHARSTGVLCGVLRRTMADGLPVALVCTQPALRDTLRMVTPPGVAVRSSLRSAMSLARDAVRSHPARRAGPRRDADRPARRVPLP